MWSQRCDLCGTRADGLCSSCRHRLDPAPIDFDAGAGVHRLHAVFSYSGVGADLIRALKYENRRAALGALVDALSTAIDAGRYDLSHVVAVPAHPGRVRLRGHCLPALIASRIAGRLGVRIADPLVRTDDGTQQTRTRDERLATLGYEAVIASPRRVLLVDDVVTTGATIASCAQALRSAGAELVVVAALATTPAENAGVRTVETGTVSL